MIKSMMIRWQRGMAVVPAMIALAVPMMITGCGGGSGSDSSTASTAPTTAQVDAAASAGADSVTNTATVMEPLTYMTESDATRSRQTDTTRPDVSITRNGTDGVTVTIDFGTGITSANGVTRSGIVTVNYDRSAHSGTVSFANYVVNGTGISGSAMLSQLSVSSDQVSFAAAVDLTVTGVSTIKGNLSIALTSGSISFPTGSIAVQPVSGTGFSASLSNISLSPSTYKDFVPYAGSTSFPYNFGRTTATVTTTFSSQSPVTGVVQVSVNGGTATPYTLPRFQ